MVTRHVKGPSDSYTQNLVLKWSVYPEPCKELRRLHPFLVGIVPEYPPISWVLIEAQVYLPSSAQFGEEIL